MKCMKKIEIYNASLIYRKEIFIQEVFRNVSWEVSSRPCAALRDRNGQDRHKEFTVQSERTDNSNQGCAIL